MHTCIAKKCHRRVLCANISATIQHSWGAGGGGGGGGRGEGLHGLNAAQWLYLQFMILSDLRATDQGVHSECNHNMMYVNPLVI